MRIPDDLDYTILFELMKDSRISDRSLAQKLGVSQPTVTRRRARLEKEKYIDYTGIPNFAKLGLRIMAFNFVSWNAKGEGLSASRSKEFMERVLAFVKDYPNLIFASTGRGMGMARIAVSLHRDYSDYVRFWQRLQREWGEYMEAHDSFVVSLESDRVVKQISFNRLIEYINP